jgi:hypothetical protein
LIDAYVIDFLSRYLKQQNNSVLTGNGAGLFAYAFQE